MINFGHMRRLNRDSLNSVVTLITSSTARVGRGNRPINSFYDRLGNFLIIRGDKINVAVLGGVGKMKVVTWNMNKQKKETGNFCSMA